MRRYPIKRRLEQKPMIKRQYGSFKRKQREAEEQAKREAARKQAKLSPAGLRSLVTVLAALGER